MSISTVVGLVLVLGVPTLIPVAAPQAHTHRRAAEVAPGMYDGAILEREGGRRWLIMRTGGRWL